MPSTLSLLKKLKQAYPDLLFRKDSQFSWDFTTQTISYPPISRDATWATHFLHEIAHALLSHRRYQRDIELIAMERDAWAYAISNLSSQFDVIITTDTVQSAMDSYRDWLHARSTCPQCHSTGVEEQKSSYHCLACGQRWKVNEARLCHLRRYQIQK